MDPSGRADCLVRRAPGAEFDVRGHVWSFLLAADMGSGVSDGAVQFSDLGLAGDYSAEAAGPRALVDGPGSALEIIEKDLKMVETWLAKARRIRTATLVGNGLYRDVHSLPRHRREYFPLLALAEHLLKAHKRETRVS